MGHFDDDLDWEEVCEEVKLPRTKVKINKGGETNFVNFTRL
jgi:hypothetical protein